MEKIKQIYENLYKKNEEEGLLVEFPELPSNAKFHNYIDILTKILDSLENNLDKLDSKKQELECKRDTLALESCRSESEETELEEAYRESTKRLSETIRDENRSKVYKKLEIKKKQLEENKQFLNLELATSGATVKKQTDLLYKLRYENDEIEKKNNLDAVKEKLSVQVDINERMKSKVRMFMHLDKRLGLGFDRHLNKNEKLKGIKEDVYKDFEMEERVYENFKILKNNS